MPLFRSCMIFSILFLLHGGFTVSYGFKEQDKFPNCKNGPISEVKLCKTTGGGLSFQGSGRFYSVARGNFSPEVCNVLKLAKDEVDLRGKFKNAKIYKKQSCTSLFGTNKEFKDLVSCFTSSQLTSNGNSRKFWILAMSLSCSEAVYFYGSGHALIEGDIRKISLDSMKKEKQTKKLFPELTTEGSRVLKFEDFDKIFNIKK